MPVDLAGAERFVLTNARLLDRHRLTLFTNRGGDPDPILQTLRAYRNPDGGFGHALEPDVRGPESEPTSTLRALETINEAGATKDPMVRDAAVWVATIARADGGLPFVMPEAAGYPNAPWMVPSEGGSFLTYAVAAQLYEADAEHPWLHQATEWAWTQIETPGAVGGYGLKFALMFLDAAPDAPRANAAIAPLAQLLDADGSLPVPGGTADERLRPLALSPRPGARSRAVFSESQIEADLDRLEQGQQDDGGWMFDWLAWSDGQTIEWRGSLTVDALRTLRAHKRL